MEHLLGLGVALIAVACEPPIRPESRAPAIETVSGSAVRAPVPRAVSTTAEPSAPGRAGWVTRVCSSKSALVVENACGCNDGLLCSVSRASAGELRLDVRLDPSRQPVCDDCFPMVPGHCALPPLAPGAWNVLINDRLAFVAQVDAIGRFPDESCWTPPPAP